MYPRKAGARTGEGARIAAGGPDQIAVADTAAVGQVYAMRGGVDRVDFHPQDQFQRLGGPELGRAEAEPLEISFPQHVFL